MNTNLSMNCVIRMFHWIVKLTLKLAVFKSKEKQTSIKAGNLPNIGESKFTKALEEMIILMKFQKAHL